MVMKVKKEFKKIRTRIRKDRDYHVKRNSSNKPVGHTKKLLDVKS